MDIITSFLRRCRRSFRYASARISPWSRAQPIIRVSSDSLQQSYSSIQEQLIECIERDSSSLVCIDVYDKEAMELVARLARLCFRLGVVVRICSHNCVIEIDQRFVQEYYVRWTRPPQAQECIETIENTDFVELEYNKKMEICISSGAMAFREIASKLVLPARRKYLPDDDQGLDSWKEEGGLLQDDFQDHLGFMRATSEGWGYKSKNLCRIASLQRILNPQKEKQSCPYYEVGAEHKQKILHCDRLCCTPELVNPSLRVQLRQEWSR